MNDKPIKIGVIGVGHLGRHHVKHYKTLKNINLVGLNDINTQIGKQIANKYKIKFYNSLNTLINNIDAVSIVTPTPYHFKIAKFCIINKKHVFIEKPITVTLEEADELIKLSIKYSVIIQVGHIERLNPSLLALEQYTIKPQFIEIQRLAPYNVRGSEVPVVLDKMIHDIDILLSLVNAPVTALEATGMSIITNSLDIAHARIKFTNGTVASIMSSRIAQNEVRKVKIFQKNLYATLDLLIGLTEVYKIQNDKLFDPNIIKKTSFIRNDKERFITYEKPKVKKIDALKEELINFVKSIRGLSQPIVDGKSGRNALELALRIQDKINEDLNLWD